MRFASIGPLLFALAVVVGCGDDDGAGQLPDCG
jgi:hypothetical protein